LILVVLFANGGIAGAIASWRRGHLWFGLKGAARLAAEKTIARLAGWRGELERGARRIGNAAMARSGGIVGAITSWRRAQFGLARQRAARRTAKKTIARLARWRGKLERGARRIGKAAMLRAAHGLAAAFDLWRALKLASGGFVISLRRRVNRWGR
jgi:hypothetical protein